MKILSKIVISGLGFVVGYILGNWIMLLVAGKYFFDVVYVGPIFGFVFAVIFYIISSRNMP